MRNLKHLRLEYQISYYTEEGSVSIEVFDNAEKALDFYISVADDQNPIAKCLISASHENSFYLCIAPITIISLTDIIDAGNEIPHQVKEAAYKALATRLLLDLPFNSESHGFII